MRVLIADDHQGAASALATTLRHSKHEVVEVVGSGIHAIQAFERHKPDVVLMDYMMPRLNGITACRQILSRYPAARIVIVSAMLDDSLVADSGALAGLAKPFHPVELQEILSKLASGSPAIVAA